MSKKQSKRKAKQNARQVKATQQDQVLANQIAEALTEVCAPFEDQFWGSEKRELSEWEHFWNLGCIAWNVAILGIKDQFKSDVKERSEDDKEMKELNEMVSEMVSRKIRLYPQIRTEIKGITVVPDGNHVKLRVTLGKTLSELQKPDADEDNQDEPVPKSPSPIPKSPSSSQTSSMPESVPEGIPTESSMDEQCNSNMHAITAREYHWRYRSEIAFQLCQHAHLSVLLPKFLPPYPLILNIYDILEYRERELVLVKSPEEVAYITKLICIYEKENDCIYPMLVEDFNKDKAENSCVVLLNLDHKTRVDLMQSLCPQKGRHVISVANLDVLQGKGSEWSFYETQSQAIINELYELTKSNKQPHCMIFPVDSILDIRDIRYASSYEKDRLVRQITEIAAQYEKDCVQNGTVPNAADMMSALKNKSLAIVELQTEISLLKNIAISFGISKEALESGLQRIQELKKKYQVDSHPYSEEEKERIISLIETEVANVTEELTSKASSVQDREQYEQMLINDLSVQVWNKLSDKSKRYLISARMTYDSLKQLSNSEDVDFSGVCLQATKTLDEELATRFFVHYQRYIEQKYPVYSMIEKWPNALKTKDGMAPLSDQDFTLGSIRFVIGVDETGEIANRYVFRHMLTYARTQLYNSGLSETVIEQKLKNIVRYTEKVRTDYRNPSAHRESMSVTTASECLGYLVEHYKKLKEILEDMKY